MKRLATAVACSALAFVIACGGKGAGWQGLTASPSNPAAPNQPTGTPPTGQVLPAEPLTLSLPGTVPPEPKDVAAAMARSSSSVPVVKHASAALATIGAGNITVTSPPVSGAAHNYQHSDGNVWAEGQDTTTFNQYHVYGTVNSLNLGGNLTSYATIGLCTWFDYDYALNQATPPNSAYLFNQNVYLLIRRVAADPPNTYRIRLGDFNGKTGGFEFLATTPFTYDMQLNPTNPIVSVPGAPPYTDHQCGTATFSINGVPVPGVLSYGADNWGWRTAAGPERYDALAGGAMLLGQVYASGNSLTSAMNFNATFWSGAIANPQSDNSDWFMRGRDRSRRSQSKWNGPQGASPTPPGILWQQPLVADPFTSGPVLGPDGTVYIASSSTLYAFDGALGAPRPGWPVTDPAGGFFNVGTPAVGPDGAIYAVESYVPNAGFTLYALNPNGTPKWGPLTVDAGAGNVGFSLSGLLEFQNRLYFAAYTTNTGYNFYVYDTTTGALLNVTPLAPPTVVSVNAPALSASGTALYLNAENGLYAFNLGGAQNWLWTPPGGATTEGSPPCVAPDGTIFLSASDSNLYALVDNGATVGPRLSFGAGGVVAGAGIEETQAIADLGGGSYHVIAATATAVVSLDQTGAVVWTSAAPANSNTAAPAIGADRKVYIQNGSALLCLDDAAGGALRWSQPLPAGFGLASPALNQAGTLFAGSGANLLAINDLAGSGILLDATALPNASFSVFNPGGAPLTGTLDTDVVYDASPLGFVPGSQFYVGFSLDSLASPNDLLVYPPRPDGTVGGVVTVNAGSLTIPPSLTPYFDNPVGTRTLKLKTDAYNRIGNDETALTDALYSFFDTTANLTFSPGLTTRSSLGKAAVLAANTNYRIDLTPATYPVAGSNSSFNGSPEAVYPQSFPGGFFSVGFGTLTEGGAVAGPDNDNTDFYDQAGLVNTLQPDAYCRFETTAGPLLASDYGFYDMNTGNWIIVPSFPFGREPQARPFDTFAFARSTAFQASDGANFSATVTVTPGKQLNFVGYPGTVPLTLGAASLTLRPLPVRVWDDPAQPDPGQPGADVTGTGPWTVPLNFLLQFGQGPWTVELDADYGGAWDDGAPGRVYTVTGSPFTTLGLKTAIQTIPNTQPPGLYTFAIRVTDSAGFQYTYVWPNTVTLGAGAPGARGNWYMAGGNRTDNGQSAYVGPLTPGVRTPVWSTPVLGTLTNQRQSPVLDGLNNSYFSSGNANPVFLNAYTAAGAAVAPWPIPRTGGSSGISTACVGADGTVYFGGCTTFGLTPSGVTAVWPNGTIRWTWTDTADPTSISAADLASENGYVYVLIAIGSPVYTSERVFTLDATSGLEVNSADVTGADPYWQSGFAISDTGTVYFHGCDRLFALSSDGVIQYSIVLPQQSLVLGRPVIAPDGTVLVAAAGTLYSFIDTGAGFLPNFTFNGGSVTGGFFQTPAVRNLGSGQYWIYVAGNSGSGEVLRKFDQLGTLLSSSPPASSGGGLYPCLGADGTVYVATRGTTGAVIAYDGVTWTQIWTCDLPDETVDGSPAIGSDGGLYVISVDGREHKIHD